MAQSPTSRDSQPSGTANGPYWTQLVQNPNLRKAQVAGIEDAQVCASVQLTHC